MKMSPDEANKLLTNIRAGVKIELTKQPDGEFVVKKPITRSELLQEFDHLAGQGISISKAAAKYGVPRGAIRNWVYKTGYIDFIDTESYPQLLDEAEVAVCAQIYHQRKKTGTTGLPYFDENDCLITDVKRPARTRNTYRGKKAA